MIVAVCLNPALDVTYRVPKLSHGTAHAVEQVTVRPGGKATNVARVLAQVGEPVTLIAPIGGASGARFAAALTDVPLVPITIADAIRTCVAVVDHDATVFNEPGPALTDAEWHAITTAVSATVTSGDVVVLSGSVPPGAPADAYAQLVEITRMAGARSIVDARGAPLAAALDAAPDVVAPNVHEAAEFLGNNDPEACAALLLCAGAQSAVVSAGTRGLYAQHGSQRWRTAPPQLVEGNPTGAGDALTAALAIGLAHERPWPAVLADCVAFGAAAVAAGVAGEIDVRLRDEIRPRIVVEES